MSDDDEHLQRLAELSAKRAGRAKVKRIDLWWASKRLAKNRPPLPWPTSCKGIPALTIKEPWASAILHMGKDVENRCWKMPKGSGLIFIHAGLSWDKNAKENQHAYVSKRIHDINAKTTKTSGYIIGIARVDRVVPAEVSLSPWRSPGQMSWELRDVIAFPKEDWVACKGKLKLWHPEDPEGKLQTSYVHAIAR